jgi:hypothetical protein
MDGIVDVASVATGALIAKFSGKTQVFEIDWDSSGRFLAVSMADGLVVVIPILRYLG